MTLPAATPAAKGPAATVLTSATLAVLALAAWLAARPFNGIIHDNRLYAVQALKYNNPAVLSGDLFFKYGSQDSFTLFSPIYGALIALCGLNDATILLLALGHMLWLLSAIALIRSILPGAASWLALLLLVTYVSNYGGFGVFNFGEGFLTPRLYSEAAAMGAMAALLRSRYGVMAVLITLGSLLHPLMMTGPVAVIMIVFLFRGRPWWAPLPLIAGGTMLAILALAVVKFGGLPVPAAIDPEWKFIVYARSPHLFLSGWPASDWAAALMDAALLALAAAVAKPLVRRLLVTTLAVCAACLALSLAGFDVLDNLLLGQAQIWRALWLLRMLAPVSLAMILWDVWQRDPHQRRTLLLSCYTVLAMFVALSQVGNLGTLQVPAIPQVTGERLVQAFMPVIALVLGLGVFFMAGLRTGMLKVVLVLACAASLYLAASWDRRDPWQRYMDGAPDVGAAFPIQISPEQTVYWPGNIMGPWAALGRQSFFTRMQGAGAIFNRGTAVEYLSRYRTVQRFEPINDWQAKSLYYAAPVKDGVLLAEKPADLADLRAVCGADLHPDVIILTEEVAGTMRDSWRAPVGQPHLAPVESSRGGRRFEQRTAQDFFIYRCKDINAHGQTP